MMNWYGGGEPHHMAELRRLFTTFGYLVANQGAVAVIGLAYWAAATHLFGPTEVGLSAAAASTALLLAAVGALGIPLLLLAEIESVDATERRVFFTTGNAIAAFVVLILAIGTIVAVALARAEPTNDRCRVPLQRPSSSSGRWQQWRGSLSTVRRSDCTAARRSSGEAA